MDLPAPMMPTAGPVPTAGAWAYEFKFDGIRIMSGADRDRTVMLTRLRNEIRAKFPELAGLRPGLVVDGELVVLNNNIADWGAVMRRRHALPESVAGLADAQPAQVMVFDVLAVDGADLRARPYQERREILTGLEFGPRWVVPTVAGDGPIAVAVSREFGLEGVVSKRLTSKYASGRRSRDWIKTKHQNTYDAVVIGWVRRSSGGVTILLAEATASGLRYLGRCTAHRTIVEHLEPLAVRSPAIEVLDAPRAAHWVRPELEVEVTAAARTPDGRLRAPKLERVRPEQE